MQRNRIKFEEFKAEPIKMFEKDWMLLCSGNYAEKDFNFMTVAWGGLGAMWNRPMAAVVVRPTRYTYEFLEKSQDFTLTAFPEDFKEKLSFCGTKSGRDIDKRSLAGLTAIESCKVKSPSFDEAELVLECNIIFKDDFKPEAFIDPEIESHYPLKDYHRMYFGEIVSIAGTSKYY